MSLAHSLADYVHQLKTLFPVGALWQSLKEDFVFNQLIEAEAQEFFRIDSRAVALCEEIDPSTAVELFDEWEDFAGLPDPCVGELPTLAQRRSAVLSKLISTGGQSRQYFIDIAAAAGFTITISEYDGINASLIDQHYWQVNGALQGSVVEFSVNSRVEERLRYWPQNFELECLINRLKPAHTTVVFAYT